MRDKTTSASAVEDPFKPAEPIPGQTTIEDHIDPEPDPSPEQQGDGVETNVPPMSKEERAKTINECYHLATNLLREKYRDEFNKLRVKLTAERGIKWEPPLSAEQKAEVELQRLLAENPGLAKRYGVIDGEDKA